MRIIYLIFPIYVKANVKNNVRNVIHEYYNDKYKSIYKSSPDQNTRIKSI
jgi:hypothetical protein